MTSSSPAITSEKLFVFPWMANKSFDLLWYFAPIVVAIAASLAIQALPNFGTGLLFLFIVNAFGVGPAHQGPTWFFYFDKRNREYWSADKKRLFVYFVAPILVFVSTVLMAVFVPGLNFVITTLWGIQHFVQQNFGISLLYFNKNNNEAIPDRKLILHSLWTPAIFFASIFYYNVIFGPALTSKDMAEYLKPSTVHLTATIIFSILGLIALFDVSRVIISMRKQVANGARINAPALMFWLVSVIYFVPYILPGQRLETVALIGGTMHWFQYIGLNMILVNQKYAGDERKHDIPCGAYLLMTVLCLGSVMIFLLNRGIQQNFAIGSVGFNFCLGIYFGLANVHYFQDAFFWKFREQFQRDSILPFLMQARTGNVQ